MGHNLHACLSQEKVSGWDTWFECVSIFSFFLFFYTYIFFSTRILVVTRDGNLTLTNLGKNKSLLAHYPENFRGMLSSGWGSVMASSRVIRTVSQLCIPLCWQSGCQLLPTYILSSQLFESSQDSHQKEQEWIWLACVRGIFPLRQSLWTGRRKTETGKAWLLHPPMHHSTSSSLILGP